jgi:hypothetical protein
VRVTAVPWFAGFGATLRLVVVESAVTISATGFDAAALK